MIWGHIQILLGMALASLEAVDPGMILNAIKGASPYQILLFTAGYAGVTYWLRSVTTKPLNEK